MDHYVGLAIRNEAENTEQSLYERFSGRLPHYLGPQDRKCKFCGAFRWGQERTKKDIRDDVDVYTNCCQKGDVTLPVADFDAEPLPPILIDLLTANHEEAKEFQANIIRYNNALAFASMCIDVNESITGANGAHTFRMSGELKHLIGSMYPDDQNRPAFAQIFFLGDGGQEELNKRMKWHVRRTPRGEIQELISRSTLRKLQDLMNEVNIYAVSFKMAAAVLPSDSTKRIMLKTLAPGPRESCTYNRPRMEEVAALVEEDEVITDRPRQLIMHRHGTGLKPITDLHTAYFSLRYPILMPYGEQGWDENYVSPTAGTNPGRKREFYTVSSLEWGAYLLFERDTHFLPYLHSRRLTQHFIVDLYLCVEKDRIRFFKNNQRKIKADLYKGITEAFDQNNNPTGRQFILPATFKPGPRHMNELYHDAMALVREFGSPSFFITMTTNSQWPEIQENLKYGEVWEDRPDLVARVFGLKLAKLLEEIVDNRRLGVVISDLMVVEFQKRGLPHAHILLIVDESSRPRLQSDIDLLVSATIPDANLEPTLFQLVADSMLHGPCRESMACYNDGQCRLRYPKPFAEESTLSSESFHTYRRPNDGRTIRKGNTVYHNGHVVPYNKYLTLLLECHINVEIPVGTKPIRYLYKYLTKGSDKTRVQLEVEQDANDPAAPPIHNELKDFVTYRHISAPEAAMRLLKLSMNSHSPAVLALQVHLPDEQLVYFTDATEAQHRLRVRPPPASTLTEFFRLCRENVYNDKSNIYARQLLYVEAPKYFAYEKKRFSPRRSTKLLSIGRLHYVNLSDGERYFLRLLLSNVRGPHSFEHIRTVNGEIYPTFREAADKLGLLQSDRHHEQAMQDASLWATSHQLRLLFALILVYGGVTSPDSIWLKFQGPMAEDCRQKLLRLDYQEPIAEELCTAYAMKLLSELVEDMGVLFEASGLSEALIRQTQNLGFLANGLSGQFKFITPELSAQIFEEQEATLNDDQMALLRYVRTLHQEKRQSITFLDGPGGTGKTYTLNTILHFFNANEGTPLAVSSSGVSAILLLNGATAHSAFKLPLDIAEDSTCNLNGRDKKSKAIINAPIIVWDEISMQHKHCIEAVDRSFKHICGSDAPFGGKTIIFSGDFRQTLPIVPGGSLKDQQKASFKGSPLWSLIKSFKLNINLRLRDADVHTSEALTDYASWLLKLGDGALQQSNRSIVPLTHMKIDLLPPFTPIPERLMSWLYEDFISMSTSNKWAELSEYYGSRCLVTPLNDTVDEINASMLGKIPGEPFCSTSIDEPDPDFVDPISVEMCNAIDFHGFPEHRLLLKVGQPVMLIRNLSLASGLCNGTRLLVLSITGKILRCKIITGPKTGTILAMPKVKIIHRGSIEQPIPFTRRQFPVISAFCLTINKSQGQTLDKVGVFLSAPVFAHGQLYVALSRCRDFNNLRISIATSATTASTANIVCRQVLRDS